MTLKAILFDKDGTLLDYHATWTSVNLEAALRAANGDKALARQLLAVADADPQTGRAAAGGLLAAGNTAEIVDAWISQGVTTPRDALIATIDRIFTDAMQRAVPIDGGLEMIRTLHAHGYVMGVASSDSAVAIGVFLESAGLAPYFQFIAGYDSGYGHKPDPAALIAFGRKFGMDPGSIAMVGDNIQDLQLGRRGGAGLVIGVLSGTGGIEALAPLADSVIGDISQLDQVLALDAAQPKLAGRSG